MLSTQVVIVLSPTQTGHNGGGRHTPAGAVHREAHQRELQSNTYTYIYSYTIHRFAASANGNTWQHNRNYTPGRSTPYATAAARAPTGSHRPTSEDSLQLIPGPSCRLIYTTRGKNGTATSRSFPDEKHVQPSESRCRGG